MGRRRGSDPSLLWLWRRPAAMAVIRPLTWEPLYATGAAQEMAKRHTKKMNSIVTGLQVFMNILERSSYYLSKHVIFLLKLKYELTRSY